MGPAMRALNPRQRVFVIAAIESGSNSHTDWARHAGYSDEGGGLRVQAYRLAHDEKILKAIHEESARRLRSGVGLAVNTIARIMTESLDEKMQLKAADMILNRGGLHAVSEHNVNVKHELDETEKLARIISLAGQLGIDPAKLIGEERAKTLPAPKLDETIEAEYTVHSVEGLEDLL